MTLTLELNPQEEAQAVRELVTDFRSALKLKLKRPHITAAHIVGAGKLLNFFDDIEKQLPEATQPQPEGLAA